MNTITAKPAHAQAPVSKDPLLQPFTLGHVTFRNRIYSTSHACGLQVEGLPQAAYQAYHLEKAKGGIGMSMFGGSSNVDADSPNVFSQLNVGTDTIIPYFQEFSERMHAEGAALMCQITHLGRRAEPYVGDWVAAIAPSPVRETLHRAIPRQMDIHDIKRVVRAYADAAWRCKEGGLDGVESMIGGHLIGQFLSPRTNHRTDGYGGSLENRCRFGLEVYEAIREATGSNFLVGMRFQVGEGPDGSISTEECLRMAIMFRDAGVVDFFNAIYGTMDTIRSMSEEQLPGMGNPIAPWVDAVGAFKREVGMPIFHATRISDLASARHAIAAGHLDLAGMTRAHIADPHLVNKLMRGEEERVRPCVGATHCQSPRRPRCLHNGATGRELTIGHDIAPARTRRRAVVIGAGPAGLEAARVLALRGHDVSIYEAADEAGGQLLLAARGSWRRDMIGIIDWRMGELRAMNVPIHYNSFMDAEDVLELSPNIVIDATGGIPHSGWFEGAELVTSTWDIIGGTTRPGRKVFIFDGTGRHSAPTAAEICMQAGSEIHYASIDNMLAQDQTYAEQVRWRKEFSMRGIWPEFDQTIDRVEQRGNRLVARLRHGLTHAITEVEADQIITDFGTLPASDTFDALLPRSVNDGETRLHDLIEGVGMEDDAQTGMVLHRIGDAQASRNVHAAIFDALRLCRLL